MKTNIVLARSALLGALCTAFVYITQAATINWTNTAGGNWNTAANWSPNTAPGAADTAVITNGGTYTVNCSGATIAGLAVGGGAGTQTLSLNSSTFTLNGAGTVAASGQLKLAGGTLGGTNLVTVAGLLTWTAGAINADAAVVIAAGGQGTMSFGAIPHLYGALTNAGTLTFGGTQGFYLDGVIHNAPGGMFDLQSSEIIYKAGTGVLVNAGTVRKSVVTGTSTINAPVSNSGTFDAQVGVIALAGGGTLSAGSDFIGAGTNQCSGGTVTFNGTVHSTNIRLAGAALAGTGALTGTAWWTAGSIIVGAALTIEASSQLTVSFGAVQHLYGALTNAGTLTFSGFQGFYLDGVIHNAPGGVFDLKSSEFIYRAGTGVLLNAGTVRKSAVPGTSTIDAPVINSGTFDAQVGVISLTGGGTFSTGSAFTGAGTNQWSGGNATFDGTVHSTNLRLAGAAITGTGTLTGTAWWTAGNINPGGALTLGADGQLNISFGAVQHLYGALTNAGTIVFLGPQGFYQDGLIHNLPSGLFDLQSSENIYNAVGAGPFINQGTVRKSFVGGTSTFSQPVVNSGIFDAVSGVIALNGQTTLSTGSDFIGAGTNQCSGGTVTFNGTVHSTNLRLAGAAITGTGTLTGTAWWTAGNINPGGALTLGAGGQLNISFGAVQHLYGALTNAGTIVFLGPKGFYQDGVIHNLPGGLFDLQSSENIYNAGTAGAFVNAGTVRKSFVGGTSTFSQPVINSGTFEAVSGVIALDGQTTLSTGSGFTGAGINQCSGGTVTFDGTVHSTNLRLAGAAVTGTGTLTGTAWWTAGNISLGGALTVGAGSQLTVSFGAVQHLYGALTNAGTIVFFGPKGFYQDGVIHNLPGGLFDLQSSENIYNAGTAGAFVNAGTVRKSFVGGTSTFSQPVINSGTFEAVSGVIALDGQTTLSTGSGFTGAGINQCSGGTVTFDGTVHSTNLRLAGAAVTGTGTLTGTAWWTAGNISLGGALTVGAGSQLTVSFGAVQHLYGALTNAGTILLLGPQGFYLDGLIHNLPGGLFDLQSSESIYGSFSGLFLNAGLLRKTVVGGTSTVSAALFNSGTVLVEIGTLNFPGTYTHAAGTILLTGATFVSTKPVYLNGGRLAGWGLCDATVTNAATVSPSGTGVLTIQGHFIQTLDGNLEIELGGLIAGTNHSRLNVTGTARPHGSISVHRVPGYLPSPGDSFVVLTAPVVYGTFKCFNGFFFLGHDRRLLTDYHPIDVTLITVTAPDPPAFEFISEDNQVIVCWPWEFPGFSLFSNTNLNQTNWSMITGIGNNRYLEFPAEPKKFFRLIKLARVWEDINGNGIQDEPASTGMNGVTVNLLDCSGNLLKTTGTTNDSSGEPGHYLFYGLRTGCFQMQFVAPEGYQFTLKHASGSSPETDSDADPVTGRTVLINLPGDTTNVTWDAGLYRPGGLANLVWEDLNGNGIQDEPASAGLNGVTVRLLDCNGSLISTTTTTNNLQSNPGYYSFAGLTQGCYQVQFVAPPGYQFTTRNAPGSNAGNDSDADPVTGKTTAINLPYSLTNLTVSAGLYRPACIGDRVWADSSRNGLQDDGAAGIGAVSVSLYRCGDPNLLTSMNTAPDGSYQFCGLMPGTYYLVFGKPSGYVYTQPNQGPDRCADSDVDTAGSSACVTLRSGQTDNCWDAGLYQP